MNAATVAQHLSTLEGQIAFWEQQRASRIGKGMHTAFEDAQLASLRRAQERMHEAQCECAHCRFAASLQRCEELVAAAPLTSADFSERFAAMDAAIEDLRSRGLLPRENSKP